jgi:hypothetical protein
MPAKKTAAKKSLAKKSTIQRTIPKVESLVMTKASLLEQLKIIDSKAESRDRVLALETGFRKKIDAHTIGLPAKDAIFDKFNTSPFVLLIHASSRHYSSVDQIERDILPAKQFSSMETSAGRMVEEVVLPIYGWQCVLSKMHTSNSALDGRRLGQHSYEVATLKSGPRCLNDEMSENFADAIIENAPAWANEAELEKVHFTYGVLYGTKKKSNKKDWHILRKLAEKCSLRKNCKLIADPSGKWDCKVEVNGIPIDAHVRIGIDWWTHLGGKNCLCEVLIAMIRACITPTKKAEDLASLTIRDLSSIISVSNVPESYNVGLLQKSQLPWLFLMARHFCDDLL